MFGDGVLVSGGVNNAFSFKQFPVAQCVMNAAGNFTLDTDCVGPTFLFAPTLFTGAYKTIQISFNGYGSKVITGSSLTWAQCAACTAAPQSGWSYVSGDLDTQCVSSVNSASPNTCTMNTHVNGFVAGNQLWVKLLHTAGGKGDTFRFFSYNFYALP